MPFATLSLSLTETTQFKRLVEFACEVEDYARLVADESLGAMVEDLRVDLIGAST